MRLLERVLSGKTTARTFHGGLKVPAHKALSTQQAATPFPLVATYYLSLRQNDNAWLTPVVKVGDSVKKYQLLARPSSNAGVMLHAPTSGTITAIAPHADIGSQQTQGLNITLSADGEDNAIAPLPALSAEDDAKTLLQRIIDTGIAGMGGAGFPTARKLSAKATTLIINAAECEPYITCDDMQIREHAADILRGAQIAAKIVNANRILFGIEDDKPEAIQALQDAIAQADDARMRLQILKTRYPSGNSRQLIELLLGVRIPSGKHAQDFDIICHNTATMKAIFDAVVLGRPLITRYTTLTGEGCSAPQVVIARIGTPLNALLAQAGKKPDSGLIIGGPMMGTPQKAPAAGLQKTTNCLLMLPQQTPAEAVDCIRCARCSDACPMALMPQQLYWYSRDENAKRLKQYRLFDCIECGICASVCPSHIPLVDYYRQSKARIRLEDAEAKHAEKARERFEAREARLVREAEAREAKMAAKRAALAAKTQANKSASPAITAPFDPTAQAATPNSDTKKAAAIAAAQARAQARRAERLAHEQGTASPSEETKAEKLAAARAKAEARRATRQTTQSNNAPPKNSETKSTISAEKPEVLTHSQAAETAKTDKLAAAHAKAEARRAARQAAQSNNALPQRAETKSTTAAENPETLAHLQAAETAKIDKLAAARAKTEARRSSRQASQSNGARMQTADTKPTTDAEKSEVKSTATARKTESNLTTSSENPEALDLSQASETTKTDKLAAARAKAEARRTARRQATQANDAPQNNSKMKSTTAAEKLETKSTSAEEPELLAHSQAAEPAETDKLAAARAKAEERRAARQATQSNNAPAKNSETKSTTAAEKSEAKSTAEKASPIDQTQAAEHTKTDKLAAARAKAETRRAARLAAQKNSPEKPHE